IAGGESAFGGDAIGAAIGSAYRPAGDALQHMAGQVPTGMLADADMSEQCAQDYRATDRRCATMMPTVPGAGDPGARA
ncbi:hypothetical protein AB0M20_34470, partial [Actinoplanes sp. NPDC051633]|uniref:hypothetical protein n=1 Tax=Actinoplanes sp. NPDC051633 TaxID=3155670 RepID=UPI0034423F66